MTSIFKKISILPVDLEITGLHVDFSENCKFDPWPWNSEYQSFHTFRSTILNYLIFSSLYSCSWRHKLLVHPFSGSTIIVKILVKIDLKTLNSVSQELFAAYFVFSRLQNPLRSIFGYFYLKNSEPSDLLCPSFSCLSALQVKWDHEAKQRKPKMKIVC